MNGSDKTTLSIYCDDTTIPFVILSVCNSKTNNTNIPINWDPIFRYLRSNKLVFYIQVFTIVSQSNLSLHGQKLGMFFFIIYTICITSRKKSLHIPSLEDFYVYKNSTKVINLFKRIP